MLVLQRFGTAEEDAYRRDLTINRYLNIVFHISYFLEIMQLQNIKWELSFPYLLRRLLVISFWSKYESSCIFDIYWQSLSNTLNCCSHDNRSVLPAYSTILIQVLLKILLEEVCLCLAFFLYMWLLWNQLLSICEWFFFVLFFLMQLLINLFQVLRISNLGKQ